MICDRKLRWRAIQRGGFPSQSIDNGLVSTKPDRQKRYGITILFALAILGNFVSALLMRTFGIHMYPFFVVFFFWICVYGATIFLFTHITSKFVSLQFFIIAIVILTIAIRLVFIGMPFTLSIDALWYQDFGKFVLDGSLPYLDFYFPYPPLFAYLISAVSFIYPITDAFRIIAIMSDIGVILCLWKILLRLSNIQHASIVILAYAFLPMSIIESGWNGHFEPLTSLFVLLSFYLILTHHYTSAGIPLGAAVATKLYPAFILPLFIFYIRNNVKRVQILLSSLASYITIGLPYLVPLWLSGHALIPVYLPELPFLSFSITWIQQVLNLFPIMAVGIFSVRNKNNGEIRNKNQHRRRLALYKIMVILFGLLLSLLGIQAMVLPVLPQNIVFYWRYPVDIAMIRGSLLIALGVIVILFGLNKLNMENRSEITRDELLIISSGLVLLFFAFILFLEDYYAWYALWPAPLFLMLKNRRIAMIAIIGLLAVYPGYAYDNFATLGMDEEKIWNDDFMSIEGWQSNLNLTHSPTNLSAQISYGINNENGLGKFWCDCSQVENPSSLENLTVVFTKNFSIKVDENMEFVLSIKSNWDPTFYDDKAYFAIYIQGYDNVSDEFSDAVLYKRKSLTNLTFIHWRSLLSRQYRHGLREITKLQLILYPIETEYIEITIDYLYVTSAKQTLVTEVHLGLLIIGSVGCGVLVWILLKKQMRIKGES